VLLITHMYKYVFNYVLFYFQPILSILTLSVTINFLYLLLYSIIVFVCIIMFVKEMVKTYV